MSQNVNKQLMGATGSSHKEVTNFLTVSGAVVAAGLACILESSEKISTDTSEGQLVGVSLGAGLSDAAGRTAVCRKGLRVPIQLKASFNPVIGAQVTIEDDTGVAMAYSNGSGHRKVNAVFASERFGAATTGTGGVAEGAATDAGTVGIALIDFPGGL